MTYYDSAEGETISYDRAMRELKVHGLLEDKEQFLLDMGQRETYNAQAVLSWLGY